MHKKETFTKIPIKRTFSQRQGSEQKHVVVKPTGALGAAMSKKILYPFHTVYIMYIKKI